MGIGFVDDRNYWPKNIFVAAKSDSLCRIVVITSAGRAAFGPSWKWPVGEFAWRESKTITNSADTHAWIPKTDDDSLMLITTVHNQMFA